MLTAAPPRWHTRDTHTRARKRMPDYCLKTAGSGSVTAHVLIWATLAVCVVLSVSAFIAAAIASLPTR